MNTCHRLSYKHCSYHLAWRKSEVIVRACVGFLTFAGIQERNGFSLHVSLSRSQVQVLHSGQAVTPMRHAPTVGHGCRALRSIFETPRTSMVWDCTAVIFRGCDTFVQKLWVRLPQGFVLSRVGLRHERLGRASRGSCTDPCLGSEGEWEIEEPYLGFPVDSCFSVCWSFVVAG